MISSVICRSLRRLRRSLHISSTMCSISGSVRDLNEHDVVDPVEELGAEVPAQLGEDELAGVGLDLACGRDAFDEVLRADVGGHDDDGVAEVDRAALGVGEAPVVEHLQQGVEHVGVRLFDLVEEHDRIGLAPDRFGELAALLVADVAGRRARPGG